MQELERQKRYLKENRREIIVPEKKTVLNEVKNSHLSQLDRLHNKHGKLTR